MDPMQTMPDVKDMATTEYSPKNWLLYYKNVWTRNAIARTIDVQTDAILKAADPEQTVLTDEGQPVAVKQRLEQRKIILQDALNLLEGIEALTAIDEKEFTAKCWSKESLAVAEDMIPKKEVAAEVVKEPTEEGHATNAEGANNEPGADKIEKKEEGAVPDPAATI